MNASVDDQVVNHWEKKAAQVLVGRTIKAVRYLHPEEVENLGWYSRSVVFELDNGTLVWPSADDEGNDAGALFTTDERADTLPVIR
jgi:hypothetical protein